MAATYRRVGLGGEGERRLMQSAELRGACDRRVVSSRGVVGFSRRDGVEIDDDRARVDVGAVHRFLAAESYWARGRDRATMDRLVLEATRVVGAYDADRQVGFARCVSDGMSLAWVADVYVEASHRGRGIGEDVARFLIEGADFVNIRWMLGTADAHGFYAKLGFGPPSERILERPRAGGDPSVSIEDPRGWSQAPTATRPS
jgi:GNAT superfamily N-acetyltransferase